MNIPFRLYDYIAVFIPGYLLFLGLIDDGMRNTQAALGSGVVGIGTLVILAFFVGHINLWISDRLVKVLKPCFSRGEASRIFRGSGSSSSSSSTNESTKNSTNYSGNSEKKTPDSWQQRTKAFFMRFRLLQRPEDQERDQEDKKLLTDNLKPYFPVDNAQNQIFNACSLFVQATNPSLTAKRDYFTAEAEFFQASFSACVILAIRVWCWGLPTAFTMLYGGRVTPLWAGLFLAGVAGVMMHQALKRKFLAELVVAIGFLLLTKKESERVEASRQAL